MTASAPLTVVFDLDGTLVETAPDLIDALSATLRHEGVAELPFDQARGLIGLGARALVVRGLEVAERPVTKQRLDELHAYFLDVYARSIAAKSKPYPNCEATLERMRGDGVRLAVCTNKVERLARQLLDALDMTRRFDAIVGGDTFSKPKPDAAPVLGAIERAGGDPTRSLMVGDSSTDVDAARAAGVPVVVMTFGYTVTPAAELGGDALVDHFDDLEAAIERLVLA